MNLKKRIAESLWQAEDTGIVIDPIRHEIGVSDIALAYSIQQINGAYRVAKGARITGKKIGLTSPAVQAQLGVDQPDFGILYDDMEVLNGLDVSFKKLMQPKIEAEIAFILHDDLDMENLTLLDVMQAIDFALPALEIVGSRIKDWDIKITDTVADNASASHYVLGHTPKTLDEFDMVNCTMRLEKNGTLASEGIGKACLGSPLNATFWLAKKMIEMGTPLMAGEIILSGALGKMVTLEAGDDIQCTIEGLGSVSVSITE